MFKTPLRAYTGAGENTREQKQHQNTKMKSKVEKIHSFLKADEASLLVSRLSGRVSIIVLHSVTYHRSRSDVAIGGDCSYILRWHVSEGMELCFVVRRRTCTYYSIVFSVDSSR
ncbi:hypothetical protein AVEN_40508-1 [Araneus ventricosus]|uniref:Uncharacterized protein n=1 Tax=Araneus ventricosus TaxID=182803 RepID=A0A4Y2IM96_ARAVE|nr:hypothetical protein AVEN_40508-1 [Araneus ventricosus]